MPKKIVVLWSGLLLAFGAGGLFALFFALQSYPAALALLEPLSKDGRLESFTPGFYQSARLGASGVAVLFIALALALLIWRSGSQALLAKASRFPGQFWARLKNDSRELFSAYQRSFGSRLDTWILIALVLLGALARLAFIMRPIEHDEAYTFVTFASATLRFLLSDYHHPNNHIFHSLLMHITTNSLGIAPWAVRLPAFLAGVLAAPLVYILARLRYDRAVAIISGAAAAALPILVYYGVNARGYTLIIVFTLGSMILAEVLRRRDNLLAWLLLVVFSALGFYTIPVFLFPFGMVLGWLFLSAVFQNLGGEYASPWKMIRRLVMAGTAVIILTVVLYTPVFLNSGFKSVFGNEMVVPMAWAQFWPTLQSRLVDNARHFSLALPAGVTAVLVVGMLLSLIPFWKSGRKVSWQVTAAAWVIGLVILQRYNPWAKVMTFLYPLLVMWAAAGWFGLLAFIQRRSGLRWNLRAGLVGITLALILGGTGLRSFSDPQAGFQFTGDVEATLLRMQSQIRPDDLIVVNPPHDSEMWYYARLHGLDMDHFKREKLFLRTLVVVDPANRQTVETVLLERGPEMFFFDLDQARLIFQQGSLEVYELIPDLDLIRQGFDLNP